DFGDRFPVDGLQMTVQQLRDTLKGPDLSVGAIGSNLAPLRLNDTLTFTSLSSAVTFDYTGNGIVTSGDALQLEADIVTLVSRYYAPFDVQVEEAAASSLTDVQLSVLQNTNNLTG